MSQNRWWSELHYCIAGYLKWHWEWFWNWFSLKVSFYPQVSDEIRALLLMVNEKKKKEKNRSCHSPVAYIWHTDKWSTRCLKCYYKDESPSGQRWDGNNALLLMKSILNWYWQRPIQFVYKHPGPWGGNTTLIFIMYLYSYLAHIASIRVFNNMNKVIWIDEYNKHIFPVLKDKVIPPSEGGMTVIGIAHWITSVPDTN